MATHKCPVCLMRHPAPWTETLDDVCYKTACQNAGWIRVGMSPASTTSRSPGVGIVDEPERITPEPPLFHDLNSEAAEKFHAFHEENPHVYEELVRTARLATAKGRTQYGINGLVEVVRWNRFLRTSDEDYKINNNYAPFYSRLIMRQEEDLKDFFKTRESIADE